MLIEIFRWHFKTGVWFRQQSHVTMLFQ